jgi:hypothetical protein
MYPPTNARLLFGLVVAVSVWLVASSPAHADPTLTLTIDSEPVKTMNGFQINIAAHHLAGTNWDISAGKLVLVLVPGPNPGSFLSASLTLTGADDTHPLMITYDGNTPGSSNSVFINFSASGFDVVNHPVPQTASLDGNIVTANPLAIGVELVGKANGLAVTDVKPANRKGPGAFAGVDSHNTPYNDVSSISGVFTFTWDQANNVAGNHVDLPNSANVTVYGNGSAPEPSTLVVALVGLVAALAGKGRSYFHGRSAV